MANRMNFKEIAASDIPAGVRFDVTGSNAGQAIELAYGGFSRAEHGPSDPYRRYKQAGEPTQYFVRVR